MALEAQVLLSNGNDVKGFQNVSEAMAELNAASFAGIDGVVVIGVGRTKTEAMQRVFNYTEEMSPDWQEEELAG